MSTLTADLKTEDVPSLLVSRSDVQQTSLGPPEDTHTVVKPKVAILPFSVEALMADRKPSRDLSSHDHSSVAGTSHGALQGVRMMGSLSSLDSSVSSLSMGSSFSVGDIMNMQDDVLIKPESPEFLATESSFFSHAST